MAGYGLLVKNVANEIVIDSDRSEEQTSLYGTGIASVAANEQNMTLNIYPDLGSTVPPTMAYKLESGYYVRHDKYVISSNNYTDASVHKVGTGTGFLYWACFVEGYVNSLPTYGLIVKDSAGKVIFSSSDQYFRVHGIYTGTHTMSHGNQTNVTVVDAVNHYFFDISASYCKYINHFYNNPWWDRNHYRRYMTRVNSTTIGIYCYNRIYPGFSADYGTLNNWDNTFKLVEISF